MSDQEADLRNAALESALRLALDPRQHEVPSSNDVLAVAEKFFWFLQNESPSPRD